MRKIFVLCIVFICIARINISAQDLLKEPDLIQQIQDIRSSVFYVKPNDSKSFRLDDLHKIKKPFRVTMELTSNPAWYIIPALSYLIDNQNQSTVEIFNGYFANSVALYLLNKEVGLDSLLKKWENEPVSDNPENEMHRKIGKMMDTVEINNRMADEIAKLQLAQLPDGSWPWFKEMKSNRYITQLICTGIGRLFDMHIYDNYSDKLNDMGVKAFKYCDNAMTHDYNALVASKVNIDENHLTSDIITYLYARTFWNVPIDFPCEKALYYWQEQAWNNYQNRTLAEKAMLVSAFYRQGEDSVYIKIFRSIDKQAIHDDDKGVYWKENSGDEAEKIQAQSLLIEAYNIMRYPTPEYHTTEGIKKWLMAQRISDHWTTDLATTDAVFALNQNNYIAFMTDKIPAIRIGSVQFDSSAGKRAGYLFHSWNGNELKPEMENININNTTDYPAWCDINILYKQKGQNVTTNVKGLKVTKQVYYLSGKPYKISHWKRWSRSQKLAANRALQISIIVKADKEMDHVHINDLGELNCAPAPSKEQTTGLLKTDDGLDYELVVKNNTVDLYIEHLDTKKHTLYSTFYVNKPVNFQDIGLKTEVLY